jgi:hypothetical protein
MEALVKETPIEPQVRSAVMRENAGTDLVTLGTK